MDVFFTIHVKVIASNPVNPLNVASRLDEARFSSVWNEPSSSEIDQIAVLRNLTLYLAYTSHVARAVICSTLLAGIRGLHALHSSECHADGWPGAGRSHNGEDINCLAAIRPVRSELKINVQCHGDIVLSPTW